MAKESKNMGAKKLNDDVLVDAGLSLLDEKIKNRISSITGWGITLTNKGIKDIIKVSRSLENRGILFKATTRKSTSRKEGF